MRTIDAQLTAEQRRGGALPSHSLQMGGDDFTGRLVSYTYRERAEQAQETVIVLDNTDGGLNAAGSAPARGEAVTLARGVVIGGSAYRAALPRVWVEALEYDSHYLYVHCIDFWGKLARWRAGTEQVWAAAALVDILDWLLGRVGLTREGSPTATTVDFRIPVNERGDSALKRLLAKVPEYAYPVPAGKVGLRDLDSGEAAAYTYGWQEEHPLQDLVGRWQAWRYNKVTVSGAVPEGASQYAGTVQDAGQIAAVGERLLVVQAPALGSDALCVQRAQALLDLYRAEATQGKVRAAPCHGLELYDVVELASYPWGGTAGATVRVMGYVERYGPGRWEQELTLARARADMGLELAQLPPGLFTSPGATEERYRGGTLTAFTVVGATAVEGLGLSHYQTTARLSQAFWDAAGRAPDVGDTLLVWDNAAGEWRLFVLQSTGATTRWVYWTATGTVT